MGGRNLRDIRKKGGSAESRPPPAASPLEEPISAGKDKPAEAPPAARAPAVPGTKKGPPKMDLDSDEDDALAPPVTDSMFLDTGAVAAAVAASSAPLPPQAQTPAPPLQSQEQAAQPSAQSDDSLLRELKSELFVSLARDECKKNNVHSMLDFLQHSQLRAIATVAVQRELLDQIFPPAQPPPAPSPPQRIEKSTVRPPRPPPSSRPPPPSVRAGSDPVSGEEDTVMSSPGAPPKRSQPPPPPKKEMVQAAPKPQAMVLSEIGVEIEKLKNFEGGTRARRDEAKRVFDFYRNKLIKEYGSEAVKQYQGSALKKKELIADGQTVDLEPLEQLILDLHSLNEMIAELNVIVAKEDEFHRAKESARNSSGPAPSAPARQSSPPVPSQRSSSAPSERPPAQAQESVDTAQKSSTSELKAPPSWFARIRASPITWIGIGGGWVTWTIYETNGFEKLARLFEESGVASYVRGFWEGRLHLPPLDTSAGTQVLYYGLVGISIPIGLFVKYLRVRRQAKKLRKAGLSLDELREIQNYVEPILYEVARDYEPGITPTKLRQRMVEDEKFFIYLDRLSKKHDEFLESMKNARVNDIIVRNFHVTFGAAEAEIIKKRLKGYIENIKNPRLRVMSLEKAYKSDEFFRKKLDETFLKDHKGDYIFSEKILRLAETIAEGDKDRGRKWARELEEDYFLMTQK